MQKELKHQTMKSRENASPKGQVERLVIKPLLPLLTQIYNAGYGSGHHDTVEGCYTDVLPVDADIYQDDIVEELIMDLLAL